MNGLVEFVYSQSSAIILCLSLTVLLEILRSLTLLKSALVQWLKDAEGKAYVKLELTDNGGHN